MSVDTLIDKTIDLTKKSIELARQEDWDSLIENESVRQNTVDELKPIIDDVTSVSADTRENLEALINLNEELSQLCIDRRADLAKHIKQLTAGQRANKAYSE